MKRPCGTQGINNLKMVCLAVHAAHDVYRKLPPASGAYGQITGNVSLSVHLLPYIEQCPLYATAVESHKKVPEMPKTALIPPYDYPQDPSTTDWVRVQNFACNLRVFTDAGFSAVTVVNKAGVNVVTYTNIDETKIAPVGGTTRSARGAS